MTKRLLVGTLALLVAACGTEGRLTEPVDVARPNGVTAPSGGVLAIGTDPVTGASIETNKDDYMPGEMVHVVGRGWGANETVTLFMTEDPDTHEDVSMSVVADSVGNFSEHYYHVQPHDLGVTFTLTATGNASQSVAVVVFTDNIPEGQITISLDGTNTVAVSPGASISLEITARVSTTASPTAWNSTGWVLTTSNTEPAG
jgi:hypothetical protein